MLLLFHKCLNTREYYDILLKYNTQHKCMPDFSVSAKGLFSKPIIKPACNIWEWLFIVLDSVEGLSGQPFTIHKGNTMLHKQRNMWCLDNHSIFSERVKYIYIYNSNEVIFKKLSNQINNYFARMIYRSSLHLLGTLLRSWDGHQRHQFHPVHTTAIINQGHLSTPRSRRSRT